MHAASELKLDGIARKGVNHGGVETHALASGHGSFNAMSEQVAYVAAYPVVSSLPTPTRQSNANAIGNALAKRTLAYFMVFMKREWVKESWESG